MKRFNTTAICIPGKHYMVDIQTRLKQIKAMIDRRDYFTINRSRQFGKTTTIHALEKYIQDEYLVISLDFQEIGKEGFQSEKGFVKAFLRRLISFSENRALQIPNEVKDAFTSMMTAESSSAELDRLFDVLKRWCALSGKPVVLIIDEVDVAAGHAVFIDFLSQLRSAYIGRETVPTFQSVILSGVTDVKHLKQKIRSEAEVQMNSPWNIAVPFKLDMSFSVVDIVTMLMDYATEHQFNPNLQEIAKEIYDCTSGYPFLVSRICQIIDEDLPDTDSYNSPEKAWTRAGVLEAFKRLVEEKNTLFETLVNKVYEFPELNQIVNRILFQGDRISYNALNPVIEQAEMYGLIKGVDGLVCISNRTFETVFYNLFLTSGEAHNSVSHRISVQEHSGFIREGKLDMYHILEKFTEHYEEIYGADIQKFHEADGRRLFLMYLKPVINGTANYYIESQTRDQKRTDIIIDYLGEQFVIELKIWRGESYNERGESQLVEYLDYYRLKKGYMVSFCFNKNKQTGVKTIYLGDKELIEAVV